MIGVSGVYKKDERNFPKTIERSKKGALSGRRSINTKMLIDKRKEGACVLSSVVPKIVRTKTHRGSILLPKPGPTRRCLFHYLSLMFVFSALLNAEEVIYSIVCVCTYVSQLKNYTFTSLFSRHRKFYRVHYHIFLNTLGGKFSFGSIST